ncbi:MAG: hypothetical protein QM640_17385 [Niabella sp.]
MKIIQLAYRKIIDSRSASLWEQYVFDDTYQEFLMQVQFYNTEKKHATFSRLLAEVPAAEKLHFLVSSAVSGYVDQLGNKIPDVKNTLGKTFLPFHSYRFEIIDSHIANKNDHRVAICFYSDPLRWVDTIGEHLLVSLQTETSYTNGNSFIQTELIRLQPFISICSIQTINNATTIIGQNILS